MPDQSIAPASQQDDEPVTATDVVGQTMTQPMPDEPFPFATADLLCCFAFLWQSSEPC